MVNLSRWLVAAPVLGVALLAACTMPVDESVGGSEGAQSRSDVVRMRYEGTCEFLRNCSRFSRGMPEGQVSWGCTGAGACEDSALWVAGPSESYCNKTVRICKGSRCTNALVKDVSSDNVWEGSNGVFDAIGERYGLRGQCSGFGMADVTVRVQRGGAGGGGPSEGPLVAEESGGGTSGDLPLPPPAAPGPPDPTSSSSSSGSSGMGGSSSGAGGTKDPGWSDDGCTLSNGDYVPDLGCVFSADGTWYQCTMGSWAQGGNGKYGPYGGCSVVY